MSRKTSKVTANGSRNKVVKNTVKNENQMKITQNANPKRFHEVYSPPNGKYSNSGRLSDIKYEKYLGHVNSTDKSHHPHRLNSASPLNKPPTYFTGKNSNSEDLSDSSSSDTDDKPDHSDRSSDKTVRKAMERREKSRVAAQIRRNRESQALILLQNAMPISGLPQALEKSGVIRIASHTLCIFNNFRHLMESSKLKSLHLQSQSLIGLIFDAEKNLVYGPPALAELTGQHWTSLVGMSYYDLIEGSALPESDKPCRVKLACARSRTMFSGGSAGRSLLAFCWSSLPLPLPPNARSLKLPNGPSPLTLCLIQPLDNINNWSYSQSDEEEHNSDQAAIENSAPLVWSIRSEKQATMFRTFHDRALVIGHVDESSSRCIGYSSDDLVGQTLYDLVHLDDIRFLKSNIDALESQEVVITKFYRMRTNDGDFRWARSTIILCREDRRYSYICKHEVSCSHLPPSNNEHVVLTKSSCHKLTNQNNLLSQVSQTNPLQANMKTIKQSISCDPILINVHYSNVQRQCSREDSQIVPIKSSNSRRSSSEDLLTNIAPLLDYISNDKGISEYSDDSNKFSTPQTTISQKNANFLCNEDFQPLNVKEDAPQIITASNNSSNLQNFYPEGAKSITNPQFMAQRAPKMLDTALPYQVQPKPSILSKNSEGQYIVKHASSHYSKESSLDSSRHDPMLTQSTLYLNDSRAQILKKTSKRSLIPVCGDVDRSKARVYHSNSAPPIRVTTSSNGLSTIVLPVTASKITNQNRVNDTWTTRKRQWSYDTHSNSTKSQSLSNTNVPIWIPSHNSSSKVKPLPPSTSRSIISLKASRAEYRFSSKPPSFHLKPLQDMSHQPLIKSRLLAAVDCHENVTHYSDSSPAYSDTLSLLDESPDYDQKHFPDDYLFDTWNSTHLDSSSMDASNYHCLDNDLHDLFQCVTDPSTTEVYKEIDFSSSSDNESFILNSDFASSSAASLYDFLCDNNEDKDSQSILWSNQLPSLDSM